MLMTMSAEWIKADWPAPSHIVAGTTTRTGDVNKIAAEPRRLHQVHGSTVIRTSDPVFKSGVPEAEAVISSEVNDVIAVRTADCLPVLLCSELGEEIAAVHCGWRGLAADVLASTINAMNTPAADLMAWFGPAISQKAFEVQDDVRDAFVSTDENAAACFEPNERGRYQADLSGLARLKLTRAGVEQIHGSSFCTYADPERFYSYRRDGSTGRMTSFIYRL